MGFLTHPIQNLLCALVSEYSTAPTPAATSTSPARLAVNLKIAGRGGCLPACLPLHTVVVVDVVASVAVVVVVVGGCCSSVWSVHKTTTEVYSWLGAGCHGGGGGVVVMVTLEAEAEVVTERGWPGNFGAMRRVCVFSSAAAVAVEYAAAAAAGKQAVFRLLFVPPHIFIEWTRTEKSNQVNWTAIKMSRLAT